MIQDGLLYSVVYNKDHEILFKVRDEYLSGGFISYINFVKQFYANYKKFPDIQTVESQFNISLSPNQEPPDYWLKLAIEKYKESVIEKAIISSAKNKKKAIDIFQEAIVSYNADHEYRVTTYGGVQATGRYKRYQEVKLSGGITYVSSGSQELDDITLGYKRADLWTIAGREGLGKTWYLLRLAMWLDTWINNNNILDKPVLIVSCEMDAEELTDRLDCLRAKIPYGEFIKGNLSITDEARYKKYLTRIDANIVIVDDCVNMADVEAYIAIYQPCAVFIDGSHNLSLSYDWKDIATLTAKMKRTTRLRRVPIVNTTHLKSGKGKSNKGGEVDDLAYSKGYTRDSDIVFIMYASDEMELKNQVGLHSVKIRRGVPVKIVYQNDFQTMDSVVVNTLSGISATLGAAGAGGTAASLF